MATMTMSEADKIVDIVYTALEDTSHRHHPISSLKGYDIYQIDIAFKLRVANEFLHFAQRDNFEVKFNEGLDFWHSGLYHIMRFVPDNQVDDMHAVFVYDIIDPKTLTAKNNTWASKTEAIPSFGDYCKSVGADDPIYWQKIYTRLGLEYTAKSPKGNYPVSTE